jgi:hypothetical protein
VHQDSKIVLYTQKLQENTLYNALLPLLVGRLWTLAVGDVVVTVVVIGTEKNDNARLKNGGLTAHLETTRAVTFLL